MFSRLTTEGYSPWHEVDDESFLAGEQGHRSETRLEPVERSGNRIDRLLMSIDSSISLSLLERFRGEFPCSRSKSWKLHPSELEVFRISLLSLSNDPDDSIDAITAFLIKWEWVKAPRLGYL
jgi:hypothetical protein